MAATGPTSPVPPGLSHLPGPGQYYASPALAALLSSTPTDQLASRYPGHLIGTIGDAARPSPNALVIVIGRTAAQLSHTPGTVRATAIATRPPSGCPQDQCLPGEGMNANSIDLVMSVVALAILFPLLIFIGTATRLALRRVCISPLGVTRRVTPKAPRAWRVLPLLAGVGILGFIVVHGSGGVTGTARR